MFFKKKIDTFQNGMVQVEALETWVVKWCSFSADTTYTCLRQRPEYQCFIDEGIARDFVKTIEEAYKLLRIKDAYVTLEKR